MRRQHVDTRGSSAELTRWQRRSSRRDAQDSASEVAQVLRGSNYEPNALYAAKLPLKNEDKVKIFSEMQKLRVFPTSKPLQKREGVRPPTVRQIRASAARGGRNVRAAGVSAFAAAEQIVLHPTPRIGQELPGRSRRSRRLFGLKEEGGKSSTHSSPANRDGK